MSGSSLLGFLVSLIALFGVGAIFFLTIDGIAKDALLAKIAKIAVGCCILIAFVLAIAAVLGFGGTAISITPYSIIVFAVGVLVVLLVIYIVDRILAWLGPAMGLGPPVVEIVHYVVTAVALIALLLVAGDALLGGGGHVGALAQRWR